MAYNFVLVELLDHISSISEPVVVDWDSAQQWPSGALECLVQSGILAPASSAQSIECNACEHHCYMDVLMKVGEGESINRAFIVCSEPDMQSQMGRVQIPLERLQQWKTGFKQLAGVIAGLLGFDGSIEYKPEQSSIYLGMLKSKGGRRVVSLSHQPLELEINKFKTPLTEFLFIDDGELVIDRLRIDELVNTKPLSVAKAYDPSIDKREAGKLATQVKHQDWQDEYALLQRKNPTKNKTWYSLQIAKLPLAQGASPETIRKHLK
ncbi:MAG: hypothetical protein DIZ80_17420 [endosymbiont of Galathealinum brachiosum]|uniref:Uncharacterized protein n=1 Tax=endosymbiont of Galathealinum brachiosum TaxID=2200906 RepID=A0A370D729_9GAMM|nr:MAG: hypothetical protein DIZ80_17420 [endosymbiont of Galathealinum brachiosum]